MHGLIFSELRKFVDEKLGERVWDKLLAKAGLQTQSYMPLAAYPDAEMLALFNAASKHAGRPGNVLLEEFGEFIVPDLLEMYKVFVRPEWKTLDLIEHTEDTIHRVVRLRTPGARPPAIRCERKSAEEIIIRYSSSRKMCSLARGIIKGVARHYQEPIAIEEPSCMVRGAFQCVLSVKRLGMPSARRSSIPPADSRQATGRSS